MFDTMTLTKIVGGFCGAFLVFLLGGFFAELIYHGGDAGHGDDHAQAYTIDVPEESAGGDEAAAEEVPIAELLASADVAAGETLFRRQCGTCHNLDGSNATGPYLNGVVGRAVASVDGYSYSGALAEQADQWSAEHLSAFIAAPRDWAPGTKMSYRGLSDGQERANIIAYLETTSG